MPKPKTATIKTEEKIVEKTVVDKKGTLLAILKQRTPAIFDKEPAPAFNSNLNLLADTIINLFSY